MPRLTPRRLLRWLVEAVAGLLALLGGSFLLGFWAFNQGWLSSERLTPFAEDMIEQVVPGFETKIGDIEAVWLDGSDFALIRLHNVVLTPQGGEGGSSSKLRRVDVSLSTTALLTARLAPSRLKIYGVQINWHRPKIAAQPVRDQVRDQKGKQTGLVSFLSGLGQFFRFPISGFVTTLSYLHEVDMRDVHIALFDGDGDIQWESRNVSFFLSRPYLDLARLDLARLDLAPEAKFRAQARVGVGKDVQLLKFAGTIAPDKADAGGVRIDFISDPLAARIFEPLVPGLKSFADLDVDTRARFQFDLAPDGILNSVRSRMEIPEGGLITPILLMPLQRMKNIILDVRADFTRNVFELREFSFENPLRKSTDRVRSKLKGEVDFAAFAVLEGATDEEAVRRVTLAVDVIDMELVYFKGMPPLQDANGHCFLKENLFRCDITRGHVLFDEERMSVEKSLFEITDISAPETRAALDFEAQGAPHLLGRWLDSFPYNRLKTGYLLAAAYEGRGTIKADAHWRFRRGDPSERDITFNIEIEMNSLKTFLRLPDLKLPIDEGELSISLTEKAFAINGHARLSGAVTHASYRGHFASSETEAMSELKLDMLLNETVLRSFDFDELLQLDGEAHLLAVFSNKGGQEFTLGRAQIDLTEPALFQPHLGWRKKKKDKSKLRFKVLWNNTQQGITLNDITLNGGGMEMRGRMLFNKRGDLMSANFPRIQVGNKNSARLHVKRGDNNILVADMNLARLDLRDIEVGLSPTSASADGVSEPKSAPTRSGDEVLIKAQIEQVIGHHGARFGSVGLKVYRKGGQVSAFDIQGKIYNGRKVSPMHFLMSKADGGNDRQLLIKTGDAGAVLRGLDIYQNLHGGEMFLTATLPQDNKDISGKVVVGKFSVSKTPTFLQILGTESFDEMASELDRQGIFFNQMELSFTRTAEQILIQNGWAVSAALGVSMRGAYQHIAPNKIAIKGTLTPAYIINSFFGTIPGLGDLLTNRKGEGLFGVSFSIGGTREKPEVNVNPLSAVTPGVLRRLFEFGGIKKFEEKEPQKNDLKK